MDIRPHAWAGIVGPVLFTAGFLAQEAFRRDDFDPIAQPVSALEAGPAGWVQQVDFVVFGVLTLVFAVGLHRGLKPSRAGIAGPALMGVSGVALLLAAAFPLREDAAGEVYDPGGHVVAGTTFFLTSALSLIVLSRRAARDPAWRGIATYALVAGLVALAGFVVMGLLVVPETAPLHEWVGLGQRLMIVLVVFPCRIVLADRLRRVAYGRGRVGQAA